MRCRLHASNREQVAAGGDERRIALDLAGRPYCRLEALVEAVESERAQGGARGALDAIDLDVAQACVSQALRARREGGSTRW